MKKLKNILLIAILFFALLATTNSFATEEFTLSKEYLTLLPSLEYTLTCSDDISNLEYTILNETSISFDGNYMVDNFWLECGFENNLVNIKPYASDYARDNEATIKLSITSVNNETKDCIIHIPSVKSLLGVDDVQDPFLNNKVGAIINLKPQIDIDNTNYIYYTNTDEQISIFDYKYFFAIVDENEVLKKIDDYTFEIQNMGNFEAKYGNGSCGMGTYDGSIFEFKSPEKIFVNKNEVFTIELNSDYQMMSGYPTGTATNAPSNWTIEDNNIVLFMGGHGNVYYNYEKNCTFYAKNVGTTKVQVKSLYDNHIIEKEIEVVNPVKKISFDKISLELKEGETYNLNATITPIDATYKDLTWSSSNESVATVDANGKITAVSNGLAVISATGYGDVEERCIVKVINPVKKISLDKTSLELKEGETYNLIATVTATDEKYKSLTWSSSNEVVATVDENGKVTAVSNGLAVISATGHGGVEERCVVLVKDDKPNNIIITTLPVTSNIKFAKNTLFNSIATVENFPILGYEGYGLKLYSSSGEEKANDSVLGSKDIISVYDTNDVITTYNVVVKGDISGDGNVRIYDSFQILKDVLTNKELDEVDTEVRDYNSDGKVAIYDAFQYLKEAILQ